MKVRLEDKAKVDALEMEPRKVNKVLGEAKLKLVHAEEMEKAFAEVNRKTKKLKEEVDR